MKVHEALSEYAGRFNRGLNPTIEEFKNTLKPKDYKQFAQLAPLLRRQKPVQESEVNHGN